MSYRFVCSACAYFHLQWTLPWYDFSATLHIPLSHQTAQRCWIVRAYVACEVVTKHSYISLPREWFQSAIRNKPVANCSRCSECPKWHHTMQYRISALQMFTEGAKLSCRKDIINHQSVLFSQDDDMMAPHMNTQQLWDKAKFTQSTTPTDSVLAKKTHQIQFARMRS